MINYYDNVNRIILDAQCSIEDYGSFALGIGREDFIEIYNWGEIKVVNEREFICYGVKYYVEDVEPLC